MLRGFYTRLASNPYVGLYGERRFSKINHPVVDPKIDRLGTF